MSGGWGVIVGTETSTAAASQATGDAWDRAAHVLEDVLSLPDRPLSAWHRAGMSRRAERWLDLVGGMVLLVLAVGWMWSIVISRTAEAAELPFKQGTSLTRATASVTAALTRGDAHSVAYLMDATVDFFDEDRGVSGRLRAKVTAPGKPITPDTLPPGARVTYAQPGEVASNADTTVSSPGVFGVAIAVGNAVRQVSDFSVIALVPGSANRGGKVGLYFLGSWPKSRGPAKAPEGRYAPPSGYIEVTPANQDTRVSDHFRLRDFLTHDQPNVWPKYMVLELRLVDKLELVLAELQRRGVNINGVKVMSGFRTPRYNKSGGDPSGRAGLSRHMYGDAADIFIDNDGDGSMDDLNHDGRRDIRDAEFILKAVDAVELQNPEFIGGAGVYPAESGHGPFIHIDTRGYRARWRGTGGD